MSSFPCNAGDVPVFPAQFQDLAQKRASVLRHIAGSERLAEVRPASRLEVRPKPEMLTTGISEIDTMTGGIPRGCLSELYGPASSGKTSMLLATISAATRRDETCVLVDASDSFDPASGQAAGIDFGKLLWVRCGDFGKSSYVVRRTSSAYDCKANDQQLTTKHNNKNRFQKNNEHQLEQVLKTTDLILQSGGFGLVALDLAGIPEKSVQRIPLASWFRFQRAVEHTKTVLLVISEFRCAESCAALILKFGRKSSTGCPTLISPSFEEWVSPDQISASPAHTQILEKMHVETELVRSRLERKPAQSVKAGFTTRAIRAG
jgi:recombination protein RecA